MPERSDDHGNAKVDINRGDRNALTAVPGIGASLADRIVAGRPYAAVDDLRRVAGIGTAVLGRLEPFLTVAQAPTTTANDRPDVNRPEQALSHESAPRGRPPADTLSSEHTGTAEERAGVYHEVPAGAPPTPDEVEGTQEEVVPPRNARNGGAT